MLYTTSSYFELSYLLFSSSHVLVPTIMLYFVTVVLTLSNLYLYILLHVPVEGVIGGSVCTHLGAKAKPSPQTDTEICLFIVIYCLLGAQVRHLATNTHPANGGRWNVNVSECTALKLIKMYNLLASKQPRTGQCTFSGTRATYRPSAKAIVWKVCEICEIQTDRMTDLQTQIYRQRFAESIHLDNIFISCMVGYMIIEIGKKPGKNAVHSTVY